MPISAEEVLARQSVGELAGLSSESFAGRRMTQAEFEHLSAVCGSAWKYSGDPKMPHAILTSGKHSEGFIDTLAMLTFPNICDIMAAELVKCLVAECSIYPDWVVGSDHASAVFSSQVAFRMRGRVGCPRYDFTEKGKNEVGEDIQRWERFTIGPEESVMNVEELVSTSTTFMRVRAAIRRFHKDQHPIQFMPIVGVLVNRTGASEIDGNKLVSPFVFNFGIYPADACPLCAAGSRAIPEVKKHWTELTTGKKPA